MKADKNGPFFRKEEWKGMLRKGMQAVGKAVAGLKLQAVGKAPPKNPGLKPRGSIEGGLVFRINLFRECGLVFRINLFRKCVV